MKDFVNNILAELKNDSVINENSLVKLVIESANKSIVNNDSYDSIYKQLKSSLVDINEHLKNDKINSLINQFGKNDTTVDSVLYEMSKVADLTSKLNSIKESNAYTNPIIKSKVDNYDNAIKKGASEFKLYPSFISEFTPHIHESSIKTAIDQVINVIESKSMDFEVLNMITIMEAANSQTPIYESIAKELKKSLAAGKYTADTINLKFGDTNLPLVTQLVNNLRITESKLDGSFTLGAGSADTRITNLIAPAKKIKTGILAYVDNRFIKITESDTLSGNETDVHINEGFIIATMNSEYIKEKHEDLYNLAEAFATLGFRQSSVREGVESNSIRNFKIGLNTNESKGLDIYLNDNKIDGLDSINLTEALTMETPDVRNRVEFVFENLKNIFAFEFIKNVSNDRLISEATIFSLGDNYIVCDKVNAADRVWNKVDETEMFNFFNEKFQYDISPIFGTKIDESLEIKRKIEEAKTAILENVNKLEGSVAKLEETINSGDVNKDDIIKLEELKQSIKSSIEVLKEEYIEIDLGKKEASEASTNVDEGKLNPGLQAYLDKKNGKKDEADTEDKDDEKKEDKEHEKSESKEEEKEEHKDDKEEEKGEVNESVDVSALMAKYGARV